MVDQIDHVLIQAGAGWVLWTLLGLSALSLGVMADRVRVFFRQRGEIAPLVLSLQVLLRKADLIAAEALLAGSPLAAAGVVRAGLAEWSEGEQAARETMAAAAGLLRARLERRLLVLGTIGNNAPFVGLLGTVIGVVRAFDELGRTTGTTSGALAPERVMSTIAEALVATAVGLLVAIPAVAVFNYFQGLLGGILADAETLGHVLLAHIPSAATSTAAARPELREVGGA